MKQSIYIEWRDGSEVEYLLDEVDSHDSDGIVFQVNLGDKTIIVPWSAVNIITIEKEETRDDVS